MAVKEMVDANDVKIVEILGMVVLTADRLPCPVSVMDQYTHGTLVLEDVRTNDAHSFGYQIVRLQPPTKHRDARAAGPCPPEALLNPLQINVFKATSGSASAATSGVARASTSFRPAT